MRTVSLARLFLVGGLFKSNHAVEDDLAIVFLATRVLVNAEVAKAFELEPIVGLDILKLVPDASMEVWDAGLLIKVLQPVLAFLFSRGHNVLNSQQHIVLVDNALDAVVD